MGTGVDVGIQSFVFAPEIVCDYQLWKISRTADSDIIVKAEQSQNI